MTGADQVKLTGALQANSLPPQPRATRRIPINLPATGSGSNAAVAGFALAQEERAGNAGAHGERN